MISDGHEDAVESFRSLLPEGRWPADDILRDILDRTWDSLICDEVSRTMVREEGTTLPLPIYASTFIFALMPWLHGAANG